MNDMNYIYIKFYMIILDTIDYVLNELMIINASSNIQLAT